MWIILPKANSFLSIVDASDEPGTPLVRARREGDIEAVFPDAKVVKSVGRDYLYRAGVTRADVVAALAAQVMDLDYPNAKGASQDPAFHAAMADTWSTFAELQEFYPYRRQPRAMYPKPVRRPKSPKGWNKV
jgi:hypothetical protein